MKIEMWSDYSCPFCYMGKKKLEKAIENFKHKDQVEVVIKSFQLSPDLKEEPVGIGHEGFSKHKNMPLSQVKAMMDNVALQASHYGLDYQMDKLVLSSTLKAHQLVKWANRFHKAIPMSEIFFDAYFNKGLNLAKHDVLLELIKPLGLNMDEARHVLDESIYIDEINNDIKEASQLGVRGVPFFVFDRKYSISGAQSDQVFAQTLEKSFQESSSFGLLANDDEFACEQDECLF